MRTVAEHRDAVLTLVEPLAVAPVPLDRAHGAVLAEDLRADGPVPRWDNSAMDGYAVRGADVEHASPAGPVRLTVAGDLPAGTAAEPPVRPGTAVRIMTGAPVPPGADAVVPVEDTVGGTETVTVVRAPRAGAHIRRAGEDVRTGDVVLTAGTVLGARQLSAAASVGAATLPVHRRARVAVVSTGSELVAPGSPLARGQIPDSNSFLLAAALEEAGADVDRVGAVPDDAATLRDLLDRLDGQVDLVVTSGGVSVGAYDVVKEVLAATGVEFVRVAMQPGKPQGLGRLGRGTPVLCLPGNPVSVHVSTELFVRPAVRRLHGARVLDRPVVTGVVEDGWTSPAGREQYMPVLIEGGADGRLRVRRAVPGGSGSHLVAGLARAEGLAVVPAATDEVRPGDHLHVIRTEP